MAKKTRARRESRPRISEAQLQAYRARRASAAAAQPTPAPAGTAEPARPVTSRWGRVDEEYAMIRADLIRLGAITAVMFAILIVLWFVLG